MLFHLQEFELDKDIKLELDKQKHDRIDIVRKELAWEAEKQRIALEKLRKRYTVHMTYDFDKETESITSYGKKL